MQTLAKSAAGEDLDLLRHSNPPTDYAPIRAAAIGSLVLHLLVIVWLGTVRFDLSPPDREEQQIVRRITPLVDPPTELTQKAPNHEKVTKQLNIGTILPSPEVHTPKPERPRPKPRMMTPPPAPAETARNKPAPKILEIEPPQADVASNAAAPKLPNLPPSQIAPPPPAEKPKLAFETPNPSTAPVSKTPNPALVSGNPMQDAMRNVARSGATGGQHVSEADLPSAGPSINLPSSPGVSQPELELKSDPMGVDFKPYLIRVLATVRRNWFAIYPEAARLGMRGQVGVEFVVSKDGSIPKVVYSAQSGNRPLDEAAVAALSASNPLPPLPTEFHGQRVVLQFTFSYNMPKR
ncbi:MAG: TonB family protein [Bryobacterales bacterium]|nr:TonB family protein [Bryobacterales bacterium]